MLFLADHDEEEHRRALGDHHRWRATQLPFTTCAETGAIVDESRLIEPLDLQRGELAHRKSLRLTNCGLGRCPARQREEDG
jgi:hypothetical protein